MTEKRIKNKKHVDQDSMKEGARNLKEHKKLKKHNVTNSETVTEESGKHKSDVVDVKKKHKHKKNKLDDSDIHKPKKSKLDDSGIQTADEKGKKHKRKHSVEISEESMDSLVSEKKKKSKLVSKAEETKCQEGNNKDVSGDKKKGKKRKAESEEKKAKKVKKDKSDKAVVKDDGTEDVQVEGDKKMKKEKKKKKKKKVGEMSEASKKKMRLKKQEKRRNKLKQKQEQKAQQQSGQSLGMARQGALQYLRQWKKNRDDWNFQKVRQTWLLKNMYEPDQVPDAKFNILLEYLEGLQGHARVQTCQDAEKLLAKEEAEEETEVTEEDSGVEQVQEGGKGKKMTPEQLERIRKILQILA